MRAATALSLAALFLLAPRAQAHDSLDNEIAVLDARTLAAPEDASVWLQRGELHRLAREFDRAEADYARADVLAPDRPAILLCRAALALDRAQPSACTVWLARFLARADAVDDATVAQALVLNARALLALGDRARAASEYGRAFATAPAPRADWALGRARLLLAGGDSAAALAGLRHALDRLPGEPALTLLAAELEAAAGDVDDAAARLDLLARASECPAAMLAKKGDLYDTAGRRFDAEAAWTQALAALASRRIARMDQASAALAQHLATALAAPAGAP